MFKPALTVETGMFFFCETLQVFAFENAHSDCSSRSQVATAWWWPSTRRRPPTCSRRARTVVLYDDDKTE
jgi:hypothetical protein